MRLLGHRKTVRKTDKRQSRRGGRKTFVGSLNLRNASDVGTMCTPSPPARSSRHCTSNRDRYPDTSTSIHGPSFATQRVRLAAPGYHAEHRPSSPDVSRHPAVTQSDFGSGHIVYTVRMDTCFHHGNDPSAGSPTETLLRLLLPLDDQV